MQKCVSCAKLLNENNIQVRQAQAWRIIWSPNQNSRPLGLFRTGCAGAQKADCPLFASTLDPLTLHDLRKKNVIQSNMRSSECYVPVTYYHALAIVTAKFFLFLDAWLAVHLLLIARGLGSPTVGQIGWAWDHGGNKLSTQEKEIIKKAPKSSHSQRPAIHDVSWLNNPAANDHQTAFHGADKGLHGADYVLAIVADGQEGGKYKQPMNDAKRNGGDNNLWEALKDVTRGREKRNDHDGGGGRRLQNRETIRPHRGSDL